MLLARLAGEAAPDQVTLPAEVVVRLIGEKRDLWVRRVGQRLVTARELDDLGDALTAQLPGIGIPSCARSVYDPPIGEATPPPRAVLAVVRDRGHRLDPAGSRRFTTTDLAWRLSRSPTAHELRHAPTVLQAGTAGHVLFEVRSASR